MRFLLLVILISLSSWTLAVIDTYQFDDQELQQRFQQLNVTLRCPKCQNQSLADSDSPIASDLRAQVYRLLTAGQSDADIKNFMINQLIIILIYF